MTEEKSIIIIDEEHWYMEPVILRLRFYGYKVKYIEEFELAIEEIKSNLNDYDLAIVDLKMPSGEIKINNNKFPENGLFLINLIKEKSPKFPVIAFTVNSDSEIKERIKKLNCERVLKGFDGDDLDRIVNKLLYSN